ncbi:hypothetical protein Q8A67_008901 [Cirrhinus molitorella]|uniref:Ig-like domain-containing protein n=1 Tax=Cirrhinus molitorella TaxID=172907 RepID=A0AA88TSU1_9TELE|nr:hypothetical protein Q8A67_008901 [Cirrhinus molitorella]
MDRCFLIIIIIMGTGLVSGDSIEPDKEKNVITNERETVKLSCSYSTTSNDVWLYWYRQYPNGELKFLAYKGASNGDTITPDKTEEFAAEGSNVTLSCRYSSAWSLLWYRQYPRSAPEFLVLIVDSAKQAQTSDVDHRLSTKIRKTEKQNHVDLIISFPKVSDSALYYCALTPTVTGNTTTLYKNLTKLCVLLNRLEHITSKKTMFLNC